MANVLVEARELSRSYGAGRSAVIAVREASCRILPGDRIALVGPSGSGKSTLLYLLARLEPPTSGTVLWPSLGAGDSPLPTFAGFVFQSPNLLSPLTAVENVALPLLIADVPAERANEAARLMLHSLELADVSDRYADDLSGGQAERVGIARALVSDPALVLADEPTGQLDGTTAARVIDRLLEATHRSGAAVIVATHDERIAARMRTRWSMDHGELDATR